MSNESSIVSKVWSFANEIIENIEAGLGSFKEIMVTINEINEEEAN